MLTGCRRTYFMGHIGPIKPIRYFPCPRAAMKLFAVGLRPKNVNYGGLS